ncbi:MAG: hypothetical protein JNJ83_10540 [Verrucomicrobiaceae bacterium]|nr:hypothetical protein [Verrucomicrobiaceae bacterium]
MSWRQRDLTMDVTLQHGVFAAALLLPIAVAVVVMVVPGRRKEVSGVKVGNPLADLPVAPRNEAEVMPLVHLCRQLTVQDMEGYILGLRHLPVERAAPVLERHVRGDDPALQLYSQAVLQDGKDQLLHRFQQLLQLPVTDSRAATWLLEAGLRLANPTLNTISEREVWLERLVALAKERLASAPPTPALLSAAVSVFNQAGMPEQGEVLLRALPAGSPLRETLERQTQHLLHQRRLALRA